MGSVVDACVPDEKPRHTHRLQNQNERRVWCCCDSYFEFYDIEGAPTASNNIGGARASEQLHNQTNDGIQENRQQEIYHESSPSVPPRAPSSDPPNMDYHMLSNDTTIIHRAESVSSEMVFGFPVQGIGGIPDCQELDKIDSGVQVSTGAPPYSVVHTHCVSESVISGAHVPSKSHFKRHSDIQKAIIAEKVKVAYDIDENPISTEGPNLVRNDSAGYMSTDEIRRRSKVMAAQMNSMSISPRAMSQIAPLNHLSDSDSDIDLESDPKELTPSSVFRERSAQKWSTKAIEKTKSDMAQQIVYLHTINNR